LRIAAVLAAAVVAERSRPTQTARLAVLAASEVAVAVVVELEATPARAALAALAGAAKSS
jgi:hypothetical protein